MRGNSRGWYAEMCRRPEWQQKRLRIMERDGWQCRRCGDKDKTLTVHHWYYKRKVLPWEYPDESLATMCETCHLKAQQLLGDFAGKMMDTLFLKFGVRALETFFAKLSNEVWLEADYHKEARRSTIP